MSRDMCSLADPSINIVEDGFGMDMSMSIDIEPPMSAYASLPPWKVSLNYCMSRMACARFVIVLMLLALKRFLNVLLFRATITALTVAGDSFVKLGMVRKFGMCLLALFLPVAVPGTLFAFDWHFL